MSARTPGLQQRSQYHSYWGQYQYDTTGAPPAPYNGRAADPGSQSLPNAPNNPLANPEFSKLEAGDIASTVDASAPIDGNEFGLWFCVYPGTLSGGDAVWARLDNQAVNVEQVVRDAHVIVVGQDGYLGPLAAVSSPPLAANGLNLNGIGDQAGITCDYLDPGNGTQLEQALLAVSASATFVDVRLRACDITLDPAALTAAPLYLEGNCALIGAGKNASRIRSGDGTGTTTQEILSCGPGSLVSDIGFISEAPQATPSPGLAMLLLRGDTEVRSCAFGLGAGATPRTFGACIGNPTVGVSLRGVYVHDCTFALPRDQQSGVPFAAVFFSHPDFVDGIPTIESITVTGGQSAVICRNVESAKIRGVHHVDAFSPQSIALALNTSFFSGQQTFVGPHVTDVHVQLDSNGQVPSLTFSQLRCVDITVSNANTTVGSFVGWRGTKVSTVTCVWGDSVQLPQPIETVNFSCGGVGLSGLDDVGISDVTCYGAYNTGINLLAGPNGRLSWAKINNVQVREPVTIGLSNPRGFVLERDALGLMRGVGIMNCATLVTTPASIGVLVSAGVTDTVLVGNHFVAAGGATAIQDLGTGTEAAHNILA